MTIDDNIPPGSDALPGDEQPISSEQPAIPNKAVADEPFDGSTPVIPPDATAASPTSSNKQVLKCHFKSKPELYAAYMPFIKDGALFIATNREFNLGENVGLILTLMEEPEKYTIVGKVIWLTPVGAQAGMRAGIGVQFLNEEAKDVRKKIETYLAGMMNSELRTNTL